MRIERRYTKDGQTAYGDIKFRLTTSEIKNPDGSVVFKLDNVEVPEFWSQVASDVLAQKYFRKAGVPARLKKVEENSVPSFLWRSVADEAALAELPEKERQIGEHSSKQVFDRLAGTWTYWGWKGGYFDSEDDAQAFYDELRFMLAAQMCAPNSPQWFNTGLHWAYGIDGPGQGHFYVDPFTGKLTRSKSAYEHPQPHACFIQSVSDDLVNDGGIMDLWVREARLFKYGSGTGSNFSRLRGEGERLSGGGKSSGLMSFLKIGDRAAGAIKSGGTTRRAAKMVIVDVDHPDIETYIDWKVMEEQKVAALVTGSKINQRHLKAVLKACVNCEGSGDDCFSPEKNPALKREIKLARRSMVPDNFIKRVIQFAKQGYKDISFPTYDTDWDSEAYLTVSGQNSNNSVRVTDGFLKAVEADGQWDLTYRKNGKVAKTLPANALWEKIGYAAWASADPGLQYHTTVNDWHTCSASGEIRASNPCSEYMFLDDTACNLASLNLLTFRDQHTGQFQVELLRARGAAVDRGPGNFGDDGAVPLARDRRALFRIPHARPRLRQYRRPADDVRHPVRLRRRPRHRRRALGHHDRHFLCDLGGNGGKARPLPRLQEEPRGHAARDAQPPPRRLQRTLGLREGGDAAGAARPRRLPRAGADRACQEGLGPGARARRKARLPQRAIDRHRPHRHHRPGDGLRHHRHRARLRPGQVQEARRRRLLQDHQPRRARSAAHARLFGSRHRRDRGLCGGPRLAGAGPRHQPHHLESERLHRRDNRQGGQGAADRLRHQVRLQQVDDWRRVLPRQSRHLCRGPGARPPSTCSRPSAFPSARSRRPTFTSAAP